MMKNVFQAMLKHCHNNRENASIDNLAIAESIKKAIQFKRSFKVDFRNVMSK